jgi:hypothetical protein
MTQCVPLARATTMRLTRLDACGAPDPGPTGTLVTNGFINVDYTPNYLDPEEITQANANGDLCVDDQGNPQLRWLDLSIVMCRVDPDAVNIITGNPLVVNDAAPTPEAVGFRIDTSLTGTANFAMELWSRVSGQSCDADGNALYGYWLVPFVVQARIGAWSVANSALNMTFTARTSADSQWGTGPAAYLVRADATAGTPEVLLSPITATQPVHFEIVSVAPPAAACGATVLAA